MRKLFLALIAFVLHMNVNAQMEDGTYYYMSESHYLEMTLEDDGWTISSIVVDDLKSGMRESAAGSWHNINLNGVDENYDGPDGFYEFECYYCDYEFNAPAGLGETIELIRSRCDLASPLILTRITEIEGEKYKEDLAKKEDVGEWREIIYDESDEEETSDFDFNSANEGFDEIEAKLLPWITTSGAELQAAILKFQPTLEECKAVFSEKDYVAAYASVTAAFAEMINGIQENPENSMDYTYVRVQPIVFDQPGIMLYPGNGPFALRSSQTEFYEFTFLDSETSEYGRSITLLVKVGDRYVIFPQD